MLSWLHLIFDDIQKWYVGGYLEIRWMSYFIGLYHLIYRFFLFITNIEHWWIICKGSKKDIGLELCSQLIFNPPTLLSNMIQSQNRNVLSSLHTRLCYSIHVLSQMWIPNFPLLTVMYTTGSLPCTLSFILCSHTQCSF